MAPPRKPHSGRTPQSRSTAQTRSRAITHSSAPHRSGTPESGGTPELIDPRWLFKALGLVFAVALLFSWGTLCLLYYQGQWQLVLHPSRAVNATPASLGLPFTQLHFAVNSAGQPQLYGWYIPAASSTSSTPTALILHGADGSIADALPSARTLHNAHLNVVLFDYRGYGRSAGRHPSQNSMETDAASALTWLISTQHVLPRQIVLYGTGIGASLAVQLAAEHHDIPMVILDAPEGDLMDRVAHDPHSALVPARLLFHETFPLAAALRTLTTPKLLISYSNSAHPPAALANAADPKVTIELPSRNNSALIPAIQRFVGTYVPTQ